MKKLYSFWLYCLIPLQRAIDQTWRHLTGFPMLKRSTITPNLYLGGQYHIRSISLLKKLGVTGIINMRIRNIYQPTILSDFHLLHLPTVDHHAPSMDYLKKGVSFIEKEVNHKGKVYIHCRAGEGRGPTMAIAYLIYTGMTFDDAFALVKKVRTFIRPTKVQIDRLKEFEKWVKERK